MRGMLALLTLGVLASAAGCQLQDECEGGTIPVLGSPSQLTVKPGVHDGVTMEAPVPCQDAFYTDGTLIVLRGSGSRSLSGRLDAGCAGEPGPGPGDGGTGCAAADWDSFRADVVAALPQSDYLTSGLGLYCGDARPSECARFFNIRDWGAADALVLEVMDQMRRWDLAGCVGVVVSGHQVMCPM